MHILVFCHDDVNEFRYRFVQDTRDNDLEVVFRKLNSYNNFVKSYISFIEDFYETCCFKKNLQHESSKHKPFWAGNIDLTCLQVRKMDEFSRKRHWGTPEGTMFLLMETANFNMFILVGCLAGLWKEMIPESTVRLSGSWFQTFLIFTPNWGRFPTWLIFLRWVETTNQFLFFCSRTEHVPYLSEEAN